MRIIAGKWKGRRLASPKSSDTKTRPTLDRVKETLFNILQNNCTNQNVADLCAGTGSLGLEALSRGAKFCTFFEASETNLSVIRTNVEVLQAHGQCRFIKGRLPKSLKQADGPFDLVFFDPPYADHVLCTEVLQMLASSSICSQGATIIVEQFKKAPKLVVPSGLNIIDERSMGDTKLYFLRME